MGLKQGDYGQKTWIPEGTKEYAVFKLISKENDWVSANLKEHCPVKEEELILDVGGREGSVALALQQPKFIHIVDPDPYLELNFVPGKYWRQRIQEVNLSEYRYKLIICAHVLGYLGAQEAQTEVIKKLKELLLPSGTLALFYNRNVDYMGELLQFAKQELAQHHYDYFNEEVLQNFSPEDFDIVSHDASFPVEYSSFEDLGHLCWFLFGAMDQDIEGVAAQFVPKLKAELAKPGFTVEQRLSLITRKHN